MANSANVIISLAIDITVCYVQGQIMAHVLVVYANVSLAGWAMRVIVELQLKLASDDIMTKSVLVMAGATVGLADVTSLWMDVFRVDLVKSVQLLWVYVMN